MDLTHLLLRRLWMAADRWLDDLVRPLTRMIGAEVRQSGRRDAPIPRSRHAVIMGIARRGLARLFGAPPAAVVDPRGRQLPPYARLLDQALGAAVRVGALPALEAISTTHLSRRATALALAPLAPPWRTQGRDGLYLSDRVWQAGEETRRQLEAVLAEHIRRQTPVDAAARDLEQFLTVAGRQAGGLGGSYGLYAARRLAHNEIREAHRLGAIEAARLSPLAIGVAWRLDPSHPIIDVCDRLASANPAGLGAGIYPPSMVPARPHVGCLCALVPVSRITAGPVWVPDLLTEDGIADFAMGRNR